MKTDIELLELAAKAYQKDNNFWLEGSDHVRAGFMEIWNPLNDDSHALRIVAALDLDVLLFPAFGEVQISDQKGSIEISESTSDDKMAAIRRAIVRAAAAIGESMP